MESFSLFSSSLIPNKDSLEETVENLAETELINELISLIGNMIGGIPFREHLGLWDSVVTSYRNKMWLDFKTYLCDWLKVYIDGFLMCYLKKDVSDELFSKSTLHRLMGCIKKKQHINHFFHIFNTLLEEDKDEDKLVIVGRKLGNQDIIELLISVIFIIEMTGDELLINENILTDIAPIEDVSTVNKLEITTMNVINMQNVIVRYLHSIVKDHNNIVKKKHTLVMTWNRILKAKAGTNFVNTLRDLRIILGYIIRDLYKYTCNQELKKISIVGLNKIKENWDATKLHEINHLFFMWNKLKRYSTDDLSFDLRRTTLFSFLSLVFVFNVYFKRIDKLPVLALRESNIVNVRFNDNVKNIKGKTKCKGGKRKTKKCKFFEMGKCKYGSKCDFIH